MTMRFSFLVALVVALWIGLPLAAHACPSCADAPRASSGGPDDEGNRNPAAYNQSIYLMVGVPYTCLAVLGFLVYRGVKKNEAYRRAHGWGENGLMPSSLQTSAPS